MNRLTLFKKGGSSTSESESSMFPLSGIKVSPEGSGLPKIVASKISSKKTSWDFAGIAVQIIKLITMAI